MEILLFAGSYLLGSIPFGLLLGKMVGADVRKEGSRNIGCTLFDPWKGGPVQAPLAHHQFVSFTTYWMYVVELSHSTFVLYSLL